MKRWIIISMLAFATSAFQTNASDPDLVGAMAAMDGFARLAVEGELESVLGVVGFYGDPQPPVWLILTGVKDKPGVLRESVMSAGKVVAERKFKKASNQDLPDIPIKRGLMKVDSAAAFVIGEKTAKTQKVAFDSVHFQLRSRDLRNEPVWMLNLINRSQVSVGVVYVSAVSGEVLRTSWIESPVQKFSSAPVEKKPGDTGTRMPRFVR